MGFFFFFFFLPSLKDHVAEKLATWRIQGAKLYTTNKGQGPMEATAETNDKRFHGSKDYSGQQPGTGGAHRQIDMTVLPQSPTRTGHSRANRQQERI